ncbi:hypothetical protein RRF57_009616 [Xylaria bambusicola]|uniref:Uncharacterized protein n=1 Tax=Xylaria bambusicola TaxID=326684 RepID=A0AAN7Z7Z2_9PEZI
MDFLSRFALRRLMQLQAQVQAASELPVHCQPREIMHFTKSQDQRPSMQQVPKVSRTAPGHPNPTVYRGPRALDTRISLRLYQICQGTASSLQRTQKMSIL